VITAYLTRTQGGYRTLERHDGVTRNGTAIRAVLDPELVSRVAVAKELERAERASVAAIVTAAGTQDWT
jgi:hypothetical protein